MSVVPYPGENVTGIVELIQYVNEITNVGGIGFFGVGILIMVGFVSFLASKSYPFAPAFGFSAFLTMITAIFLRFMDLINDSVLFIIVVLFVIALVMLLTGERGYVET